MPIWIVLFGGVVGAGIGIWFEQHYPARWRIEKYKIKGHYTARVTIRRDFVGLRLRKRRTIINISPDDINAGLDPASDRFNEDWYEYVSKAQSVKAALETSRQVR